MSLVFGSPKPMQRTDELSQRQPEDLAVFSSAFETGQEYLSYRSRMGKLYWIINTLTFKRACGTVHAFIDAAVHEALRKSNTEERTRSTPRPGAFIDSLAQMTEDKRFLRDQCLNLLLAGRDTTACCLTWTM